jgi:cation-transporting ATPase I
MTGDGANDAPAIRLADVGIALGTRATDAARSASDLVIVDDSIETIVSAVVEGRALWKSVRDAVSILVGGNLGEVAFTLLGSLPSGVAPLNARQLLLVNLMTDALPAMAVAVSRPPDRSPRELLHEGPDQALGRELDEAIVLRAMTTGLGAAGGWLSARVTGRRKRAGTTALVSLVGTELGQTIASSWRSPLVVGSSVLSFAALGGIVQTPGLSQMFGCTPLGPLAWMQAMTSAGLATAGSLVAPGVLDRFVPAGENGHRRLKLTLGEPDSLEAGG